VEHGIDSPRTWLPSEIPEDARFPLLVKVREGFGSRHIYRADDVGQLEFHLRSTPVESMVQELCRGDEFSIDVLCDTEGRCLNAIPRSMIQSKGGESIKGESLQDSELIEHGARVAETIGIVGPANIQCFREPDGSLPVTDVNPRFGGAFPLPLAAGSRYPELALALARGDHPEPRLGEFRAGVVMTRFFSDLCLVEDGNGELVPFAEELPHPIAVEPGQS
jgi:carbamoyl-phosphate synthase large subunit